jgi:hypothetical protein
MVTSSRQQSCLHMIPAFYLAWDELKSYLEHEFPGVMFVQSLVGTLASQSCAKSLVADKYQDINGEHFVLYTPRYLSKVRTSS